MTQDPLDRPLRALALLADGDLQGAHDLVRNDSSQACTWVHAHVHRIQGDLFGARYLYLRAGKPVASGDHATERRAIGVALATPQEQHDDMPAGR